MQYDGNVAFKLNWVRGLNGAFTTPCTTEGRHQNIQVHKRVWCKEDACPCKAVFLKERATGISEPPVEDEPCYETMFKRLKAFSAGVYHHGPRMNDPIPMRHAEVGKLAFLTSRPFDAVEAGRIVFACFEIADVGTCEEWQGETVFHKKGTWFMLKNFKKAPLFWKFHQQNGGPRWNTGLFRYLPDDEASSLHKALLKAGGH